jgi:subtilisin family serine protease
VSINLDRRVRSAVSLSAATVKADAARRMFSLDCSALTWAVVDTGIDARHRAFRVADVPFSTRVTKTLDFTRLSPRELRQARASRDFVRIIDTLATVTPPRGEEEVDPYLPPHISHGTHVAGILAGALPAAGGRQGVDGICPNLNLWDLRVLSDDDTDRESRALMALQYVRAVNAESGADLAVVGVNLSIWTAYRPESFACGWTPICEEVRRVVRSGVVVVAAAGNTGFQADSTGGEAAGWGFTSIGITDPGNAEEAITVGATHRISPYRYGASYFSSKGPTADGREKPDLIAPGEGIVSALRDNGVGAMSGTSFAAPHVSGAAALLMARYPELVGQPERIKAILRTTATDLGRDRAFQGSGLLDVLRAIQSV